MTKSMTRGKQQILFNYLPGKTFDFERGPIARVKSIRGFPQSELNETVIVQKIASQARAWSPEYRPALGDHVLNDVGKFVLLDPVEVDAEMFPNVFWCQNAECGQIIDDSRKGQLNSADCPRCRSGKLIQLRFVKVHRCGAIEPLVPHRCPNCRGQDVSLNTRDSERLAAFRWVCRKCGHAYALFGGVCRHCEWPKGDSPRARNMDIEVHRAGRTYYPQTTVLLNIPRTELESFQEHPHWQCIVAAKFLNLSSVSGRRLSDFFVNREGDASGISASDLDDILEAGITAEQAIERLRVMREARKEGELPGSDEICQAVQNESGISLDIWRNTGSELLEAIMPFESGSTPTLLSESANLSESYDLGTRLGFKDIALVQDYTIVNATFGFKRVDYQPNECWLNPFPPDPNYGGRLPIYVDRVQADALLIKLDPETILRWLSLNGINVTLPSGSVHEHSVQAYFVRLFDNVTPYHTFSSEQAEVRMVFGLLHSLSHLCVRQASLLCGLERSSLSEYLLPHALTIAIYCNHRFGATIGALTALFEQTLNQWLTGIRDSRTCVYDPVCNDHEASCHACTHLSETSCRFFNLNLSRSFLFGGPDRELGTIKYGYFELPLVP